LGREEKVEQLCLPTPLPLGIAGFPPAQAKLARTGAGVRPIPG